jgi:S1-C subfamily serine protease
LSGENSWDAGIVGSDNELDLALLRLIDDQSAGPPLELAPADSLQPGQTAFAIGFPLGLGKTISHGIVTGIGRVLHDSTLSWLEPMLQTDVAVNPGNSGGPLLDDCGRVIGLVSRTSNPALGEDIGFAVPVSVLTDVLPELARSGRISRPWHGLYGRWSRRRSST